MREEVGVLGGGAVDGLDEEYELVELVEWRRVPDEGKSDGVRATA